MSTTLTIEQQLQYALRGSIQAALDAAEIEADIHAQKLDSIDDLEAEEIYPIITIATSTPVPMGHKSRNINVPAWISVMVYLPDDKKMTMLSTLVEIVFNAVHRRDDWNELMPDDNTVVIPAVTIDSSDEPAINDYIIEQTTNLTIDASLTS